MEIPKLTLQQKEMIFSAIRTIEELLRVMDSLQQCGEDCALRRQEAATLHANLNAMLTHFGAT